MKSDRNIVKDILHAQGLTDMKTEDVTEDAIRVLRDFGQAKWSQGDDNARYEYEVNGG